MEVLIEDPHHIRIKIENVTECSFGQDDNGKPIIWAAGKAGWYQITPSDRYLSHYSDSVEAVDLFCFMVDQHQKLPRKRQRFGFMIDPFLTDYQKHTGYRIDDDDDAMETIHKHHRFLLTQMLTERWGVDWSQSHLWKHLAETYPEEVDELKAGLARRNQHSAAEDHDTTDDEAEDSPPESGTTEESEEESQAASEDVTDSEVESTPEPIDWTRPIFDMLNILRKSPNFNMRHCGIDEAATELENLPAFEGSHDEAVAAFERSAEPLLRLMNEAKLRKKFNWSTRRIYDELEATLADEVAEETMKTPGKPGKQRHRMKSVLRPSGAGKAHKRARGAAESLDEDEEMSDVSVATPISRRQARFLPSRLRETTADLAESREDSPSRQLNGYFGADSLPELSPGSEAQEMLDLVAQEAKRVGRQYQTTHLQAFLGQWVV